jgi:hypothetical protein
MKLSQILARFVLQIATRNPPRGREEWARAMRSEFDVLDRGGLGWAIGCWSAMSWWRLKADVPFLALIPVLAGLVSFVMPIPTTLLVASLPDGVPRWLVYPITLLQPGLAAMLLGAIRPDRVRTAAIGMAILDLIYGTLSFYLFFGVVGGPGYTLYDAPPVVGAITILGVCYLGAFEGARLRGSLPARRAR